MEPRDLRLPSVFPRSVETVAQFLAAQKRQLAAVAAAVMKWVSLQLPRPEGGCPDRDHAVAMDDEAEPDNG
jgi:hypothetical protein